MNQKISEPGRIGVDFTRIEEKRVALAYDPSATSAEADTIFKAIQLLLADEATEDQKKHAVALGIVASRLPHGQRKDIVRKLLSLAPRRSRAALLQNLILSGEIIDIDMVKNGIAEVFAAAEEQSWILSGDSYELKEWLRLLPFTRILLLKRLQSYKVCQTINAEWTVWKKWSQVSVQLPEMMQKKSCFNWRSIPKFYANRTWRDGVIRRGTLSAAMQFVDLAANDVFGNRETGNWRI